MSSANVFNSEKTKLLSSGKGLRSILHISSFVVISPRHSIKKKKEEIMARNTWALSPRRYGVSLQNNKFRVVLATTLLLPFLVSHYSFALASSSGSLVARCWACNILLGSLNPCSSKFLGIDENRCIKIWSSPTARHCFYFVRMSKKRDGLERSFRGVPMEKHIGPY